MPLIHDGHKLALLKRSVGRDHAEPRPLSPIQVAEYIEEMKSDLDDPSGRKTAARLGISPSLVSDFTAMIGLPPEFRRLLGWGPHKGGVPWSVFRRAGPFLRNGTVTQDDLRTVMNGVLQGQIPASLVEEILYLKKKNPDKAIGECRREILNLIPAKTKYVVFVADLEPAVKDGTLKAASDKAVSPDDLVESVLSEHLGQGNTEGVLIRQGRIKIALTERGRKNLGSAAKRNKVPLAAVANRLLKDGLGL